MRKIEAIIKRPDEEYGHKTWISDTLENLQKTVGGYIETVTFGDLIVICDEEGALKGYEYNCSVGGIGFVGTIAIVGDGGEDFADVPIDFKTWKESIDGTCVYAPGEYKWVKLG